ncbi:MAG: alpha/beta hydrolase [Chloroflexi bacterium]|nr:alpha/beta hydrolase [Chloroflexota bacterium]
MITAGYKDRDVNVRDLKLHYQEWGEGQAPAVLMLHGFGVSGHMFDEFGQRMSERFHLIALDQRGHGDSDWSPEGDYSRDAFVADADAFAEAIGLDRFILVGHSMGGLNAVAYTAAHPEKVRALVLVDVGPEAAKEGVDNILRFTQGPDELEFDEFVEMAHRFNQRRTIENIRERMSHRLRQMENGKWTWKFDRRFRQKDSPIRVGSDLTNDEVWALYRSISVPTLLVRGAESDVLTQDTAERAAREMQRARLVVVPGAGHSVPGDNPDDFTSAVREFLDDLARGQFEPVAAAEPPPLSDLVEAQAEAQRRRAPGTAMLVLAGVGAALLLAVLAMGGRRAAKRRGRKRPARLHVPRDVTIPSVDVDAARQRAAALLEELGHVSRDSMQRARAALAEADLQRARAGAEDVLHVLGERTRAAPGAVRGAARKVDARAIVKKARKVRRKRGMARRVLRMAMWAPLVLAPARKARGTKPRRTLKPWRA